MKIDNNKYEKTKMAIIS